MKIEIIKDINIPLKEYKIGEKYEADFTYQGDSPYYKPISKQNYINLYKMLVSCGYAVEIKEKNVQNASKTITKRPRIYLTRRK